MATVICPHCNRIYYLPNDHQGDFICNCSENKSASEAAQNEDILVVGDWTDYSGSGGVKKGDVQNAGISNTVNPRAKAMGKRNFTRTSRGNNISAYRTRPHEEYIEIKNEAMADN